MVIFSLSQLKGLEELMLDACEGATAGIVVDIEDNKVVYLQWNGTVNEKEFGLQKIVSFRAIRDARFDVLGMAAMAGSKQFAEEVKDYEISNSKE